MGENVRPDPDALLARVTEEEGQKSRGRLKIFLGYVAGVGKTYAMLEAAHQRQDEGRDVVVAYVETHGRKETESLLEGLEVIPPRRLDYHGMAVAEMDLDAVLARRPQLALVDELAHSNVPGSRHPKRYQDVEELLNAGVNVYTTVNIQHLESLKDVIHQITGVTVHETVPDSLVDDAFEIELVDLPTDELLQRLRSGKVYVPDQAARALELFFRKGNLTALRELSLREAAGRVDSQMLDYMQARAIPGPWPAGERILVSLSSHPLGERLLRAGRRLADDLTAEWTVLFVETPGHLRLPPQDRQRLADNLRLAEDLGATVVRVPGASVVETVIDYAREHNITKIVAGKPLRPRWYELLRGSVIDQIIRHSGAIDVYVVSQQDVQPRRITPGEWLRGRAWNRYAASLALVALAALIGVPLHHVLDPTNLVMIFLAAVVIAAVFLGRGPSILASLASVLVFDYFFVAPHLSFSVYDTQYLLTFIGLLLVGLIISSSASLLRDQVDALQQRNRQTQAMSRFSRELTGAASLDEVLQAVIRNVGETFGCLVAILLPEEGRLAVSSASPGVVVDASDLALADWVYKNGQPAGSGTDTLPAAAFRFTPLKTAHGLVGVLGIRLAGANSSLSKDQTMLLEGFANLSALAAERASFAEQAAHAEVLRSKEALQTALLNSISHELRTPLASITGVLTGLRESEQGNAGTLQIDPHTRAELIESATGQARQLNRLVENLLDMTRLEAGAVTLRREMEDIQDLIGTVANHMAAALSRHPLQIQIPEGFPLISMDAILIAQVLANLLDNAAKYSPPGSPIVIRVVSEEGLAKVSVCDQGYGIPPDDLERVFNKFYRVQRESRTVGTGLGLSISRGFVEAHGGRIWAENNPGRGVTVTFTLPLGPQPRPEGSNG